MLLSLVGWAESSRPTTPRLVGLEDSAHPTGWSGQDFFHHVAMHVGQAVMPALELERQPGVVDAQAVQQGRMQVVDVHGIASDVVAVIVGFAMCEARL